MTTPKTITFEGIDGAGKETQSKLLTNYLIDKGYKVTLVTFPDYSTDLGKFIKASLRQENFDKYALQMLFSADRIRQMPNVLQNTNNYDYILLDRYKWSSVVYGCARGLNENWVRNLESILPDPDITFLIDIPVDVSIERTQASDILEGDIRLLQTCRDTYLTMSETLPNWYKLNGTESENSIYERILAILDEVH